MGGSKSVRSIWQMNLADYETVVELSLDALHRGESESSPWGHDLR